MKRKEKENSKNINITGRQRSEAGVRDQLDVFEFRESDSHRLVRDPAVIVVQQVHNRPVEPINRRVVSDGHVERPHDLGLLFRFDASLLQLD